MSFTGYSCTYSTSIFVRTQFDHHDYGRRDERVQGVLSSFAHIAVFSRCKLQILHADEVNCERSVPTADSGWSPLLVHGVNIDIGQRQTGISVPHYADDIVTTA